MPVAECKRRVSWREFTEWRVFYRRDPWDGFRIDANAAYIVSALLGNRSYKISDLTLRFGPRREQEPEDMERILRLSLGMDNGG